MSWVKAKKKKRGEEFEGKLDDTHGDGSRRELDGVKRGSITIRKQRRAIEEWRDKRGENMTRDEWDQKRGRKAVVSRWEVSERKSHYTQNLQTNRIQKCYFLLPSTQICRRKNRIASEFIPVASPCFFMSVRTQFIQQWESECWISHDPKSEFQSTGAFSFLIYSVLTWFITIQKHFQCV